ncbi:MAG: HupE/UreJ family protein [Bauldia litoralis]
MKRLSYGLTAILAATLANALAVGPAAAHTGVGASGSLFAGLVHPALGADHVVAMVAVGLWAALRGGRALWVWPAVFVAVMVAGFGLAAGGIALPAVEPTLVASVAVLGLAAALALRLSTAVGAAVIIPFALAHGHAHGAEIGAAQPAQYVLGFVLATAALHLAGIGLARAAARPALGRSLRVATALAAGATAFGAGL